MYYYVVLVKIVGFFYTKEVVQNKVDLVERGFLLLRYSLVEELI